MNSLSPLRRHSSTKFSRFSATNDLLERPQTAQFSTNTFSGTKRFSACPQPVIGAAQNAIKDILNETQPVPITVEKILSEVARTYNTTADMLRGPSRRSNVSSARKVSMYVVREITGMSMEDIGSEFGGRDHSTVVYSINDMQKKLETDTRLRETVEDIIKNVRT